MCPTLQENALNETFVSTGANPNWEPDDRRQISATFWQQFSQKLMDIILINRGDFVLHFKKIPSEYYQAYLYANVSKIKHKTSQNNTRGQPQQRNKANQSCVQLETIT